MHATENVKIFVLILRGTIQHGGTIRHATNAISANSRTLEPLEQIEMIFEKKKCEKRGGETYRTAQFIQI